MTWDTLKYALKFIMFQEKMPKSPAAIGKLSLAKEKSVVTNLKTPFLGGISSPGLQRKASSM